MNETQLGEPGPDTPIDEQGPFRSFCRQCGEYFTSDSITDKFPHRQARIARGL